LRTNGVSEEEEIEEIVRIINDESRAGASVVVEGETDRAALLGRGVTAHVLTLRELILGAKRGGLEGERILVLLDLDSEGEALLRRLRSLLPPTAKLDTALRERIRGTQRYRHGRRTIQQIFMAP
jgi:5S rRNA maturation endonuclease (ribonuclease M5)